MTDRTEPIPHIEHFANGNVKMRGAHLADEMHGPWEFYRLDGSLLRSGTFDRGRQIGLWRTHDRAGKVVKETDFGGGQAEPAR
jgi:antitoxin component YwqK of YwqJK toxin-antitoxin module